MTNIAFPTRPDKENYFNPVNKLSSIYTHLSRYSGIGTRILVIQNLNSFRDIDRKKNPILLQLRVT